MNVYIILTLCFLCLLCIIYYCKQRTPTHRFNVGGIVVNVDIGMQNYDEACKHMLSVQKKILYLLIALQRKYKIGITDSECATDTCQSWLRAHSKERAIVEHLLRGYNYEQIYENRPHSRSTAYSIDKGREIHICLRDANNPMMFVPINEIIFVTLHEMAHIAAYDVWGHPARFWSIFKWLLHEAVANNIYIPRDYRSHPVDYCGFTLNHSPLFDSEIDDHINT